MKLVALDKWVFSAILVALLINIASSGIGNVAPWAPAVVWVVLIAGLVVYAVVRAGMVATNYYLYSRFSILIFVLDDKNRLLLYLHPHFRRYIPPGGRLALSEAPDEAVGPRLLSKAGIASFAFDPLFHARRLPITDRVEEVVRPFAVHREHRRQRGGVRSHYCFVYVCRPVAGATPSQDCRWVDLEDLEVMSLRTRPFDDIIAKYRLILDELPVRAAGTR